MELIDKDVLAAEIERLKGQLLYGACSSQISMQTYCKEEAYNEVLSCLDTLEVKEVDLEKHLKEDIEDVFFDLDGVAVKGATHYLTVEDIKDIAKHFFELGFKAQKGE